METMIIRDKTATVETKREYVGDDDSRGPYLWKAWLAEAPAIVGYGETEEIAVAGLRRNAESNYDFIKKTTMLDYDVIVDEVCPSHSGRSYAYQYHNENFVRWESVCEGCQSPRQEPRPVREQATHERLQRPQCPQR